MFPKLANSYWLILMTLAVATGTIAWRFAFFFAPSWWTGEPARLAGALGIQPGIQVADIGAGSGALALKMAELVGTTGRVYAPELNPERRADIERRVDRASVANVSVVAAAETETRLPVNCCEAVYMRAVFHHIGNHQQFASDVARALRPGGRIGLIDFAPGSLWFHGSDHGVEPDSVLKAFQAAGLRLKERTDNWGGGMYLLVFEVFEPAGSV